jgi:hypothetical protein
MVLAESGVGIDVHRPGRKQRAQHVQVRGLKNTDTFVVVAVVVVSDAL